MVEGVERGRGKQRRLGEVGGMEINKEVGRGRREGDKQGGWEGLEGDKDGGWEGLKGGGRR